MISRRSFLTTAGGSFLLPSFLALRADADSVPAALDHIILGCNDLDAGVAFMLKKSGYQAAMGGSHPGRGTRNALLALGNRRYLEILAPDPEQPVLLFHPEIAELEEPKLVGWAIRHKDLTSYASNLRARGFECNGPVDGSRTRPDGQVFRWKTLSYADDKSGLRPFYIEWDEHSPHPSAEAPGGCLLTDFHVTGHLVNETPPLPGLQKMVRPEKPAQLQAKIAGLLGAFELTSKAIPSEAWTTK
jgi:Glyoxalase-like domain